MIELVARTLPTKAILRQPVCSRCSVIWKLPLTLSLWTLSPAMTSS